MHNKNIPKPQWFRKKIRPGVHKQMRSLMRSSRLYSIFEEEMCLNITKCFSKKQACKWILGTLKVRPIPAAVIGHMKIWRQDEKL